MATPDRRASAMARCRRRSAITNIGDPNISSAQNSTTSWPSSRSLRRRTESARTAAGEVCQVLLRSSAMSPFGKSASTRATRDPSMARTTCVVRRSDSMRRWIAAGVDRRFARAASTCVLVRRRAARLANAVRQSPALRPLGTRACRTGAAIRAASSGSVRSLRLRAGQAAPDSRQNARHEAQMGYFVRLCGGDTDRIQSAFQRTFPGISPSVNENSHGWPGFVRGT